MDYPITGIPGFESRTVVVRSAGVISGPKLLVDDEVIKGSWGKYTLRRNDGTDVQARLVNNLFDPIPQLVVGGKTYTSIPPLPWIQTFWAGAPFLLLFIGGFIGALLGAVAVYFNTRIFRSNLHIALKFVVTGLISGATAMVYLILAILLRTAIQSQ